MSARPCPGKLAASRVATLPLSQMARCVVRPGSTCVSTSNAEKPMGACAWCMPPLPVAGAVSMAGQCHQEATSGQPAAPSPSRRCCSSPATRDWSRRQPRRACLQLHSQRLEAQSEPARSADSAVTPLPLSRAQRAHFRLSWQERLARNARAPTAGRITLKLFGIPEDFATSLGLTRA